MKERLNYIDWLKAIAIISVVMGHVIGFDFFSLEDSSKSFLNRFITSIHMPLFIFLSGLVVSYKFESITDICEKLFIKARVLLFPVILVGIPYALWRGFTLYEFVTSPMKYGYWYLLTLFELYILLYLVLYLSKFTKFKWGGVILGFFTWCGLKGIGHLHLNADFLNAIQFTQLVVYWPFFFIAALINKYQLQDKLFTNNNLFTVSLFVFGGLFIYKESASINNLMMYPMQFAGIFCIIYLVYKIKDKKNRTLDRLNVIGRNSLDIYIFHYFFIHVGYMKVIGNYFLEYPNFILETIVTFIYAIIIFKFRKYSNNVIKKAKEFDNSMIITILMSPNKRYSTL